MCIFAEHRRTESTEHWKALPQMCPALDTLRYTVIYCFLEDTALLYKGKELYENPSETDKKALLHLSLRSQSKPALAHLCERNDVPSRQLIPPTHVSSELYIHVQTCYTQPIPLEEIRLCLAFRHNLCVCTTP